MSSDCEGLRGAGTSAATQAAEGEDETEDQSDVNRNRARQPFDLKTLRAPPKLSKVAFKEELDEHRQTASYKKRLQWAKTTLTTTGMTQKIVIGAESRRTIVKDLYPRFLYTFSDVVCYVTNNPK